MSASSDLPAVGGYRIARVAFAWGFAAALIVALVEGPKFFYYDSGGYWALGGTFFRHGHFSLLNFADPIRGYLLPLIDHFLMVWSNTIGWHSSFTAECVNALTFALIGAVLAPRLAELSWPRYRWGVARRVILTMLLIVLWSGYLSFPLSDFPALALAMLALVAVGRPESMRWAAVAGLACGAAIEIRPAYELLAPVLVAFSLWSAIEKRKVARVSIRRHAACLGLLVAGMAIVAIPQSLATHRHFGIWSPIPGAADKLISYQLTEGLLVQATWSYVGSGHPPEMRFEDPEGARLLATQPDHVVTGLTQYAEIIVAHPITMAKVFFRHAVNGFDLRYSTPYTPTLDNGSHRWLRLTGFLLVFLALLRMLWPAARRRLGPAKWRYVAALAVCCLTSIPTHMEPRYMLPGWIACYALVLQPAWPNPVGPASDGLRRYRTVVTIAAAYVIFTLVVLHTVSDTTKNFHFAL
jgi:hypothetical protein